MKRHKTAHTDTRVVSGVVLVDRIKKKSWRCQLAQTRLLSAISGKSASFILKWATCSEGVTTSASEAVAAGRVLVPWRRWGSESSGLSVPSRDSSVCFYRRLMVSRRPPWMRQSVLCVFVSRLSTRSAINSVTRPYFHLLWRSWSITFPGQTNNNNNNKN